jgi:hypothetical protein
MLTSKDTQQNRAENLDRLVKSLLNRSGLREETKQAYHGSLLRCSRLGSAHLGPLPKTTDTCVSSCAQLCKQAHQRQARGQRHT